VHRVDHEVITVSQLDDDDLEGDAALIRTDDEDPVVVLLEPGLGMVKNVGNSIAGDAMPRGGWVKPEHRSMSVLCQSQPASQPGSQVLVDAEGVWE
jgi:hypothetical protein